MVRERFVFAAACLTALVAGALPYAAHAQAKLPADDLAPNYNAPAIETDFVKRVEMVPMHDGVKLYTVIVIPKGGKDLPIVLTRTCYNAASRAARSKSGKMIEALPLSDEDFVRAG